MPSDDELFAIVCSYFSTKYPASIWERLTMTDTAGRKYPLAVPVEWQRGARTASQKKVDATRESTTDEEVEAVIIQYIDDAETRMTTGMLFQKIEDNYLDEPGFKRRNIQKLLAKLMRDGEIVNYREDPKDGMGRGYGMKYREK